MTPPEIHPPAIVDVASLPRALVEGGPLPPFDPLPAARGTNSTVATLVEYFASARFYFAAGEPVPAWTSDADGCSISVVRPELADVNVDGFVTAEDFDLFSAWFTSGDLRADFDGDGFVTGEDFDGFTKAYERTR